MLRRLPALLLLLLPLGASAQNTRFGFEYRPQVARVVEGSTELPLAWAGGMNSPLFSNIDLNGDGQQDLFVFERMTNRAQTFLSVANASGSGRRWQYAPEYESLFPTDLRNWVLLRDYDCDGRPDLWTQVNGGDIRLFRNVAGPGGRPTFQLASAQLTFFNTVPNSGQIYMNVYDIPAIEDIDGDGKVDILIFNFANGDNLQYYRNVSASCGGLSYRMETPGWGDITACQTSCTAYATDGTACRASRINHTGGFGLLLQDFDRDGDKDLLVGRDGCPEVVGMRNTGTATVAATNASSQLSVIPNGVGTVLLPNFPVPFAVDVTHDGVNDLVVASGLLDNTDRVSLRRNVLLFENTGTATAPAYSRRGGSFLQDQMLDVSEAAATAFADLDGDGRLDMLVANHADQYGPPSSNPDYRSTLAYYRNTGTATQPVFTLVTNDYLGLSARNFLGLRPVLTDLNRDGAVDLVFTGRYIGASFIFYFLNTAAAGQPVSFNTAQLNDLGAIGNFPNDKLLFTDVDGDGHLDLLIGTSDSGLNTSLSYYRRNPALPLATGFTLVTDDFGGIRTSTGDRPFSLSPAVVDADGDGTLDLLTLDHTGTLRMFSNYRAQTGVFQERTDLIYNSLTGQYEASNWGSSTRARNHLSAVDLNADGAPELVIGLEDGGVLLYGSRNRVTSARRRAEAVPVQLYPNPAAALVNVETPAPSRLLVRDLLGRVVREEATLARRHQLSVQGLTAGVYLVEATDAEGRRGVQRLTVK